MKIKGTRTDGTNRKQKTNGSFKLNEIVHHIKYKLLKHLN